MRSSHLRLLIYTGLFAGCAVLLSGIHFPVGPTKVFPFQHTINVLAGIILGPWYGALAAFLAGIIRISIGTGTIFAIPGGIPGALVVGFMYRAFRSDWVALTEPIGTGPIGATLSALIVAPLIGKTGTWLFFQSAFLASSIPGSVIGLLLAKSLRKLVNLDICYGEGGKKC